MTYRVWLALGCLVACSGVTRADEIPAPILMALKDADSFELLSLEPFTPPADAKETFRGWEVIGKTTIKDAKVRDQLVTSLKAGVTEYKDDENSRRCFNPRHAIRATYGNETVELVICFSCGKIRAYQIGKGESNIYVTEAPTKEFNDVLKAAGVPLPKN